VRGGLAASSLICDQGLISPQAEEESHMEWKIIVLNFLYATLGVILMFIAYRVIDWLTPQVDFPQELRKGNVAVAIFIAAIFVSIALIIGGALK